MFKWLYEKIKIFKEREIRIFGVPVIQYGSRVLLDGSTEKYFRIFHKSIEHQFLDLILTFIPNDHDVIFLNRVNAIGETYVLNFLIDDFIRNNNFLNPCIVGHKSSLGQVFSMFTNIPFYYTNTIKVSLWNNILLHNKYKYRGKTFIVWHAPVKESLETFNNLNEHYVSYMQKKLNSTITPKTPQIPQSVVDSVEEKMKGLNMNKFVFLSIGAKSTQMLPKSFWIHLAHDLQAFGYDVFINSVNEHINNVFSADLSLSEVVYLASQAQAIVSLRSGMSELISALNVPHHVIYTHYLICDTNAASILENSSIKKYPCVKSDIVYEYNSENESLSDISNSIIQRITSK